MSKFEVIALVVGDTFSEKHHSTALLLVCDGFSLAIDCPDMYRSVLRSATESSGRPLSLSDIDHVYPFRGGVARVTGSMRFGSHDEHQQLRRSGQAHRTIGRGAHRREPQGGARRARASVRVGSGRARRSIAAEQVDRGRQTPRVG